MQTETDELDVVRRGDVPCYFANNVFIWFMRLRFVFKSLSPRLAAKLTPEEPR